MPAPAAYQQGPVPAPGAYQQGPMPPPGAYQQGPVPAPAAYQQGPMPAPQHYQGGPPGRRRSSSRVWLIAVAAVVVLAAVGSVAFLAGRSKPHSNTGTQNAAASAPATSPAATSPAPSSPAASSASASQLPGAATMAAIGNDLAQSASARPAVADAVDNVQNCSESPSSAEATLQQAINTRQNILQGLSSLSTAGLPNGPQLVSAFTKAMQNSLDADNDYYAWLADLVSAGASCGSDPNSDSNYVNATSADTASTTSKQAFVAIWNPMAPQYGQQTYSYTGF